MQHIPKRLHGKWTQAGWRLLQHVMSHPQPNREPTFSWVSYVLRITEGQLHNALTTKGERGQNMVNILHQRLEDKGWPVMVLFGVGGKEHALLAERNTNEFTTEYRILARKKIIRDTGGCD